MLHQLLTHSPDLKRLKDENYDMEICGGYLVIHHVPYLNSNKELNYGSLVSQLDLIGDKTIYARNNGSAHIMHFTGDFPCEIDGTPINGISLDNNRKPLTDSIEIARSFSNKPTGDYADYYEKVKRYADIISHPAKAKFPGVTEKVGITRISSSNNSVFHYQDTNASRANIEHINTRLASQIVALVGIGGTGSYILDLVAKCPVQEIHLFDGDRFEQHNVFRSPGAVSIEEVQQLRYKVDFFADKYSVLRKNIFKYPYYITQVNLGNLKNMDFVFLSIDKNKDRKFITDYLVANDIPFIEVGLGVTIENEKLVAALKVTTATPKKNNHLAKYRPEDDVEANAYASNIQIADLNSLNATLAVIKWKKMYGFYADMKGEHHLIYTTSNSKIISDDFEI